MKVICTKDWDGLWYTVGAYFRKFFWSKKQQKRCKGPEKDDILTVVDEKWFEGRKFYSFVEWPGEWYAAAFFKPVQEETTDMKEVTFSEIKKEVPVSAN